MLRRILQLPQVVEATGETRSTIYKRISEGEFPGRSGWGLSLSAGSRTRSLPTTRRASQSATRRSNMLDKANAPAEVLQDQSRGEEVNHKHEEISKPEFETQHPDDFDWERDPAVILHDQAAVAAYFNPVNELVVKQRDTLGYEATIFITPENVQRFLEGLDVRARPAAPKKLKVIDRGNS